MSIFIRSHQQTFRRPAVVFVLDHHVLHHIVTMRASARGIRRAHPSPTLIHTSSGDLPISIIVSIRDRRPCKSCYFPNHRVLYHDVKFVVHDWLRPEKALQSRVADGTTSFAVRPGGTIQPLIIELDLHAEFGLKWATDDGRVMNLVESYLARILALSLHRHLTAERAYCKQNRISSLPTLSIFHRNQAKMSLERGLGTAT